MISLKLFLLLLSLSFGNTEKSRVGIWQLDDTTIPDLQDICSVFNISSASEKCVKQLDIVCENSTLLATMFDSWSKFPYSGLNYASRMDLGNFDQCLTLDHKYEGGRILGEFCATGLILPDFFGDASDPSSFYTLAVCRPNACSANDFNTILSNSIENFSLPLFQDRMCQTVETGKNYTAGDIVTILIISAIALLMVVSSIYDVYLHKMQRACSNPLYLAFSIITNGKKLVQVTKNSKEQIYAFQGIRVISMMWIVAGHGFSVWNFMPVTNAPAVNTWIKKTYSGYITTAPLAVDSFFFMSGFLLAYQYLKQKPKPLKDHLKSIPQMYIHRYIRITPALLMLFLVIITFFKHLGIGPLWFTVVDTLADPCRKYWWSFFLYVQNYVNHNIDDASSDTCIVTTWYLSADMQMFLLSPLVLIPIALQLKHSSGFKKVMIELLGLNVFCIALPIITKLAFRDYDNGSETHSRFIDYFAGVMLGVFMRVRQDKPFLYMIKYQDKSLINLVAWLVTLLGMLGIIIGFRELDVNDVYVAQSVLMPFIRMGWCAGLSWIAYSCYHGYGGIVNWILSRPIFQVWGKLTYCMYILHIVVIMYYIGTIRTRLYFSDYNAFYLFCGHYIITAIISVFWTLAFESPLIIIEKVVLGGRSQRNENKRVEPPRNESVEEGPSKPVELVNGNKSEN